MRIARHPRPGMERPDPKPYLRPGDIVDVEIDGLGHQRQLFREA
jgi:2-keto-4-pentenoate hydratase/2-oxohepta-3-ene-1,7-dioic acid hydratase in catechol pathway